jgi:hypothetical protein
MCCGKATDASFLLLNIICDAKWQESWTFYNDNTGAMS